MDERGPIRLRDLTPKDFYFIQILRNEGADAETFAVRVLLRLVLNEESLEDFSIHETRKIFDWALENLLSEKIMSVEAWLQTAFHMCKERWDDSIDWLERQPMPKIILMTEISKDHAKSVAAEVKKSQRKKK